MNWTLLFFVLYLLSVLLTEAVNDGYEAVKNCNCPPRKNKSYFVYYCGREIIALQNNTQRSSSCTPEFAYWCQNPSQPGLLKSKCPASTHVCEIIDNAYYIVTKVKESIKVRPGLLRTCVTFEEAEKIKLYRENLLSTTEQPETSQDVD